MSYCKRRKIMRKNIYVFIWTYRASRLFLFSRRCTRWWIEQWRFSYIINFTRSSHWNNTYTYKIKLWNLFEFRFKNKIISNCKKERKIRQLQKKQSLRERVVLWIKKIHTFLSLFFCFCTKKICIKIIMFKSMVESTLLTNLLGCLTSGRFMPFILW